MSRCSYAPTPNFAPDQRVDAPPPPPPVYGPAVQVPPLPIGSRAMPGSGRPHLSAALVHNPGQFTSVPTSALGSAAGPLVSQQGRPLHPLQHAAPMTASGPALPSLSASNSASASASASAQSVTAAAPPMQMRPAASIASASSLRLAREEVLANPEKLSEALRSGSLRKIATDLFHQCDTDRNGKLMWNNGETRTFVALAMDRFGLRPPPEKDVYSLYQMFDKNGDYALEIDECLELLEVIVRASLSVQAARRTSVTVERKSPKGSSTPGNVRRSTSFGMSPSPNPGATATMATSVLSVEVINIGTAPCRGSLRTAELPRGSSNSQFETWLASYEPPPIGQVRLSYPNGSTLDLAVLSLAFRCLAVTDTDSRATLQRQVESGSILRAAHQQFRICDRNESGSLTWNNGEIREFVISVLLDFGFSPPDELQIYDMYAIFDTDRNFELDALECVCLIDSIFRAIYHAQVAFSPVRSQAGRSEAEAEVRWLQHHLRSVQKVESHGLLHRVLLAWRLAQVQHCFDDLRTAHDATSDKLARQMQTLTWEQQQRLLLEQQLRAQAEELDNRRLLRPSPDAVDAVLQGWLEGKKAGLLSTVLRAWQWSQKQTRRWRWRSRSAVEIMTRRRDRGPTTGLLAQAFMSWAALKASRVRSRSQRRKAQISVDRVLRQWELGDRQGLLSQTFSRWCRFAAEDARDRLSRQRLQTEVSTAGRLAQQWVSAKRLARAGAAFSEWKSLAKGCTQRRRAFHAAVQLGLAKWERGETHGALQTAFSAWHAEVLCNRHSRMHQRAEKTIELMMDQWVNGTSEGLLYAVFQSWRRFSEECWHERAGERANQSVDISLQEWERQEGNGILFCTFKDWRFAAFSLHEERKRMVLKEHARVAVDMVIQKWRYGDELGSIASILSQWHKEARNTKRLRERERARKAIQLSLMKAIQGSDAALEAWVFEEWRKAAARRRQELLKSSAKDRACASVDLVLRRWEIGDLAGLRSAVFVAWHREVVRELKLREGAQAAAAVELALERNLRGDQEGLLAAVFCAWRGAAVQIGQEREADERVARAKAQVVVALARWEKGDCAGLLAAVLHPWQRLAIEAAAERARDKASDRVQEALRSGMGSDMWLLVTTFGDWRKVAAERALQEAQRRKKEASRASVELVVARWKLGEDLGLLATIVSLWWKCTSDSLRQRDKQRANANLHLALERQFYGDDVGLKAALLREWRSVATTSKHVRALEASRASKLEAVELALERWELGEDKGLMHSVFGTWQKQAEASRRAALRDRAHHSVDLMLRRWQAGDSKGLLSASVAAWRLEAGRVRRQCECERAKTSVGLALQRSIRGAEAGLLFAACSAWQQLAAESRVAKQNAARKERARASVDLVVQRWERGDSEGLIATVLQYWRKAGFAGHTRKAHERAQAQVAAALEKSFRGDIFGILASLLGAWRLHCVRLRQQNLMAAGREASRLSVEVALRQWESNDQQGLASLALLVWHQQVLRSHREAGLRRADSTINLMLRQKLRGDLSGLRASTFVEWRAAMVRRQLQERRSVASDRISTALRKFSRGEVSGFLWTLLARWRQEAMKSAYRAQRGRSHEGVLLAVARWERGQMEGLLQRLLTLWHSYATQTRSERLSQRQRDVAKEQIHLLLEQQLRGWEIGLLATTFSDWMGLRGGRLPRRLRGKQCDRIAASITKWARGCDRALAGSIFWSWRSEREKTRTAERLSKQRAAAAASVELSLQRWRRGGQAGLVATIVMEWRKRASGALTKKLLRHRTADVVEKTVQQWVRGEMLGLMYSVLATWHRDCVLDKRKAKRKSVGSNIDSLLRQWELGETLGILLTTYQSWHYVAQHEKLLKRVGRKAGVSEVLTDLWCKSTADHQLAFFYWQWHRLSLSNVNLNRSLTQRHQDRAQLELILAQWAKSWQKGLLASVCLRWRQIAGDGCKRRRVSAKIRYTMESELEGRRVALLRVSLMEWQSTAQLAKRLKLKAKSKRSLVLLADDRSKLSQQLLAGLILAAWKRCQLMDAVLNASNGKASVVQMVLQKWEEGNEHGLVDFLFLAWRDMTRVHSQRHSSVRAALDMALAKWEKGQTGGLLLSCFGEWSHLLIVARALKASRTRSDVARKNVVLAAEKWLLGRQRAILVASFRTLRDFTKDRKRRGDRDAKRKSVELALKKWSMGQDVAITSSVFTSWRNLQSFRKADLAKHRDLNSVMDLALRRQGRSAALEDLAAWRLAARISSSTRRRRESCRDLVDRMLWNRSRRQVLSSCLREWHHWCVIERIYLSEVDKREKRLSRQEHELMSLRDEVQHQHDELVEKDQSCAAVLFCHWRASLLQELGEGDLLSTSLSHTVVDGISEAYDVAQQELCDWQQSPMPGGSSGIGGSGGGGGFSSAASSVWNGSPKQASRSSILQTPLQKRADPQQDQLHLGASNTTAPLSTIKMQPQTSSSARVAGSPPSVHFSHLSPVSVQESSIAEDLDVDDVIKTLSRPKLRPF